MSKIPIKENNFEPAGGGSNGTLNYGTGYGTPNYASQDPAHFESSDNNKAVNQNSNTTKDTPNSGSMGANIDALYKGKKETPSPDDAIAGIKYELGQQIKKDKRKAKEIVVANLRKNPKFYSELHQLNITDRDMVDNMTEQKQHPNDRPAGFKLTVNVAETKKIFSEMACQRDNKFVINADLVNVMDQMWDEKKARNSWRGI